MPQYSVTCRRKAAIALLCMVVLCACATSPSTTWSVGTGEKGIIDAGTHKAAVLDSRESFHQFLDSELHHDDYGKTELFASGRAFAVDSGTKVLVLEWDSYLSLTMSRVRILDGDRAGLAGWVAAKQIRPL